MSTPPAIAQGLQHFQHARALRDQGDLAGAAAAFGRASALIPNHPGMLAEYGQLAAQLGDWVATEQIYRRIGRLKADSGFEGHLGMALLQQGKFEEAIPYFRAHLVRESGNAGILRGLGVCLSKLARWDEALECGLALERLAPGEQAADIMLNALFYLGRGDELDSRVEDIMRLFPDRPGMLALCGLHLLKRGDGARGFALQRSIRWGYDKRPVALLTPGPEDWDGTPFDGTLLVSADQGLGEEILASGFFPALAHTGQRAVIECEPRLLPVFRRSFPAFEFRPRGKEHLERIAASGSAFRRTKALDLACFLPHAGTDMPRGWLRPDAGQVTALRERYRKKWPNRAFVAISWASQRVIRGTAGKSAPITAFAPLLQRPDIAAISAQYGDVGLDLASLGQQGLPRPFVDTQLGSDVNTGNDLDGLLAQLCAIDAVVTVSNSTAHLAAAAGVPVHLLLPNAHPVFWYWGYAGSHTPWYPAMRIWRNGPANDWRALVGLVATDIQVNTP